MRKPKQMSGNINRTVRIDQKTNQFWASWLALQSKITIIGRHQSNSNVVPLSLPRNGILNKNGFISRIDTMLG